MTKQINLLEWVEMEKDVNRRLLRQGMHSVIVATAEIGSEFPAMVMKGGVLMAVRYGSNRYTTDVDYSTTAHLDEIDAESFISVLDGKLQQVTEKLAYDMMCRVQGHKINPARPDATFPTLQVNIGLARASIESEIKKLRVKMAVHKISIDYSFNEWEAETETLEVNNVPGVRAYDLTDLIAEKYRSLLQQIVRKRARYQDVYDLDYLFSVCGDIDAATRSTILEKLMKSANGKIPGLNGTELQNPAVKEKSKERYSELTSQVDNPPPFEQAYSTIANFYQQLPWQNSPVST
jgi:predicted nucleotidyltransferase component of viral defense system